MKKILYAVLFTPLITSAQISSTVESNVFTAQQSADYYESAYKLYGTALRLALHNIIKGHTVVSYASLYTHYQQTDNKSNGKVWDMYSDIPGGTPPYEYSHGVKNCGNYSKEGDCYNREHSWPQSWFNSASTPGSDLFQVYPTDGYVNNRRSNYPFGKVGSATWTALNGSKVGGSISSGYNGTVFEPINAYKGDFARSQFYMSVRYYLEDGGWSTSPATNKSDLLSWYSAQLLQWHLVDSISAKEVFRNNAVFGIQKNRNPFIDRPEFATEIWNTSAPPAVSSVAALSQTKVMIDFSRYLDSASSVTSTNFIVDQSIGNPVAIQWGVNNDVSKLEITTPLLQPGTKYSVQIKNLKSINNLPMNDTAVAFTVPGTTDINRFSGSPNDFILYQNYPNPFNPSTTITYQLPVSSFVSLTVSDLIGREISVLVHEKKDAGLHRADFIAHNLPSGLYFYSLKTEQLIQTKKMSVMK